MRKASLIMERRPTTAPVTIRSRTTQVASTVSGRCQHRTRRLVPAVADLAQDLDEFISVWRVEGRRAYGEVRD
jgi:hypothetical protein